MNSVIGLLILFKIFAKIRICLDVRSWKLNDFNNRIVSLRLSKTNKKSKSSDFFHINFLIRKPKFIWSAYQPLVSPELSRSAPKPNRVVRLSQSFHSTTLCQKDFRSNRAADSTSIYVFSFIIDD